MNFRQFAEQVKDAAEAGARGLRGSRDLTPFLHLESASGINVFPIDPDFFVDEQSRGRLVLITRTLIRDYSADKVGWTFTGVGLEPDGGAQQILTAIVLDREVEECWTAPIIRGIRPDDIPVVGGWSVDTNAGAGFLVGPLQEALR